MIKVKTEISPKTDTFGAVESQKNDTSQSEGTIPEDDPFEVINAGCFANQSHDKLPFSDMDICFKTPSEQWKTFKVHKVFMVNSSGYFADRIREDENENRTIISIMERNIEESDFKRVLDLIYCGKSEPLTKEKESQILDLLNFFKIENFKIAPVVDPTALPSSMNAPVSTERKKRPTSPERLKVWGGAPKKVKVAKPRVKVEKPNIKLERPKVKVEKVDRTNSTPFTEEELAQSMQYNIISVDSGAGYCVPCGKRFSELRHGNRHFKTVHAYQGADTSFCQGCGVKLPTSQMVEHFKTQSCGFEFNENLKKGQDNTTDEMDKFIIPHEGGKGMCLICQKEFSELRHARRHYRSVHSHKSEIRCHCVICGKDYKDLGNHYKSEHNVEKADINKWFEKLME